MTAKFRLNNSHRALLLSNAEENIFPQKLKDALDTTYAKAEPVAKAIVQAKFKASDMIVLERYSCAGTIDRATIQYPDGGIRQFQWKHGTPDDARPRVPSAHEYRNSGHMYLADAKGAAIIEAWHDAKTAFDVEYTQRRASYRALIYGANYLEDLLEVWPEAASMVPTTKGAIIALGPDQVEAVKRDLAEQRKRDHHKKEHA